MQRIYDGDEHMEGRRALVARLLSERPWCEVCLSLKATENPDGIVMESSEAHEILRRSAGGDILDETNILCICWAHHSRIHRSPTWAKERGFLRSRYEVPQP
jgi:hypothetical protein